VLGINTDHSLSPYKPEFPTGLKYVECQVGWYENSKRVHVRLDGRFNEDLSTELLGWLRVTRWVWDHFVALTLHEYCRSHGVQLVVTEVNVQHRP
jgi:hypothetical protein